MRIELVDRSVDRRKRQRDRRKRRRTSRAFDSAIALPEVPVRGKERKNKRSRAAAEVRGLERQSRERHQRERQDPTSTAARRARRAATRSLVRRLPALLLLVALIGALLYGSTDARFFVYEAEIQGAQHLAPATVYETAGVHEQNIFWLDPRQIARSIVALEGITAARVSCELPARVLIEVEERQPAIMWRATSQGRDWWLDAEGRVLPYHGDATSPDTIFVLDTSYRDLDVGQTITPAGIARSVMQLAEALPDVQLFYYQADRGLSFTQQTETGSWPVYVGSSEDLARKIQVMLVLTTYLKNNDFHPRYMDVRWPDHPVYGQPAAEVSGGGQ